MAEKKRRDGKRDEAELLIIGLTWATIIAFAPHLRCTSLTTHIHVFHFKSIFKPM
jgi:hypothetical protein